MGTQTGLHRSAVMDGGIGMVEGGRRFYDEISWLAHEVRA